MGQGVVYLIGAGPGNPDYITVKGLKRLRDCDVVVYDFLASDRLLREVRPDCKKIYVGKRAGHHSMKQEEINQVLVEHAGSGLRVARLKGGDPFVFGRGGEEVLALTEAGIPYEVVPGVTSAVAVPASVGIPVTHRGVSRSFHVMTGHTLSVDGCDGVESVSGGLPEDFLSFASLSGTLVFLMGLGSLPLIVKGLIESGKLADTPAAVIEQGTMPGERSVRGTLENIEQLVEQEQIGTPAIIVVGSAVSFHMENTWREPLQQIRIGLTGTPGFTGRLAEKLENLGADTCNILPLEVKAHTEDEAVRAAYENLESYGWIVFTSANAVKLFIGGLLEHGKDMRSLGGLKLAAVGSGTAKELLGFGFRADYVPERYDVESLANGLAAAAGGDGRLLIPRSSGGSPELNRILDEAGIEYDDIILYEVCCRGGQMQPASGLKELDYLIFASASGVRAFMEMLEMEGTLPVSHILNHIKANGTKIACIGDKTAEALRHCGTTPDLIGEEFSIDGLAEVICNDVRKNRP